MKVLVVISAVLAVAAATGPGFAYSTAAPYINGLGYQGLGYNGLAYNGLGYNGLAYNGLGYNGLGYNGLGYNGLAYNGLGYNGLAYNGIHGYSSAVLPYSGHVAAPVAYGGLATKTQYHAQDEFGQASFGHATHDQTHAAFRDAAGGVTGTYSYVNPEGKVVAASYIADVNGYRVASNDLPVAPAVPAVPILEGPAPVQDTIEVVEARAQHLAAHAEAKSRQRRQAIFHPLAYGAHAYPYAAHAYPYALPYAAHAVRPATLTTIVNNPGHAVSYRVD